MTKADLIQLLDLHRTQTDLEILQQPAKPTEHAHKHYIRDQFMTAALVNGQAVRAVCGVWFVPTRDATSTRALPLCPRCETGRPLAQAVLDLIRERQSGS